MKNSFVFLGVVAALLVTACASQPLTYKVSQAADPSMVQGQKTVVFNLAMAERKSPSMGAYWGAAFAHILEGGLFIYPIVGAGSISAFKKADAQIAAELPDLQAEWQTQFDKSISDIYAQKYGAQTVSAVYPFADTKYKITYFNKPDAAIKEQIASICRENGATYAVTTVGQVIHGTGGGNQSGVSTELRTEVCIFDSAGNLVAHGYSTTSQLALNPASLEAYAALYTMGQKNTEDLIGALVVEK
jgi:hypothetical protein